MDLRIELSARAVDKTWRSPRRRFQTRTGCLALISKRFLCRSEFRSIKLSHSTEVRAICLDSCVVEARAALPVWFPLGPAEVAAGSRTVGRVDAE